ncbi:MAG: ABC transporter ATP-binding protein [Anaerolineae bacterium]|nr:ABC transporter ATP-binding protein [Anaerolineae bacterium]
MQAHEVNRDSEEHANGYRIQVAGLSFAYPDGRVALRDVSLRVTAGEKVALVGHNGAGKSTLLLHLIGILHGNGRVWIDGVELTPETARRIRSKLGLIFQDPNDQLFSPTVFDDVAFGPLNMGFSDEEVVARTEAALAQVGLSDFGPRMPHHLSLGEKKRVSIATVLSMSPTILALDEPSAGLDPKGRRELIELLQRLPLTILLASHDLALVREVCDRAVVMAQGRVVAELSPDELPEHESLLYPQDLAE